ncbi:unnamed protein product, partial [Didymodactylos carnosus]
MRRVHPFDR